MNPSGNDSRESAKNDRTKSRARFLISSSP